MNLQEVRLMSWTDELYKIYENNCGKNDFGIPMLPVSHSTANAQIELTLKDNGEFVSAHPVDKSDAVTIIPVTEDSGSRSSGIAPMPLADKLVYIAGDYSAYAEGKRADNSDYFAAYLKRLKEWRDSENSHPAVKAVCAYLEKSCIMKDLVESGVLKTDPETGRLDSSKISGIAQQDAFVRFRIIYSDDTTGEKESRTWFDSELYDSFITFNSASIGHSQLCYATGKILPCTYKHPAKIRNAGDKAKLISSNDETESFTYRGRFADKKEALSVSYDFSQKMHNALKWLIAKQGMNIENSLMVIVWASALQPLPDIRKSFSQCCDDEFPDEEAEYVPDTEAAYSLMLNKMIFGYEKDMDMSSKVMIMGLDAATTGRLSIAMYTELEGSAFLENIKNWHSETAWPRLKKISDNYKNIIDSFGVYEIAECAFGTEQNGVLKCKSEIKTDTVIRLIPCITEGRKLPADIMRNLYEKASNPLAYENGYNHRKVVETACGIIKKYNYDHKKGVISMSLDHDNTERSYLYGRLLAVADKAESDSYDESEKGKRITNAKRYWNNFSSRPYRTWGVIEQKLRPYLDKQGVNSVKYEKLIQEIMNKMDSEEFKSPKALEPSYLLGYHCQLSELYPNKSNAEGIENKEE